MARIWSETSAEPQEARSRGQMWFGPDGKPVDLPLVWRAVLAKLGGRSEPVAGIHGEGQGAGERSAPASIYVRPKSGAWWTLPEFWSPRVAYRTYQARKPGEGIGIPCGSCGLRGTVRLKPRVYGCPSCLGISLLTIGRREGPGLLMLELEATAEERGMLRARIDAARAEARA